MIKLVGAVWVTGTAALWSTGYGLGAAAVVWSGAAVLAIAVAITGREPA